MYIHKMLHTQIEEIYTYIKVIMLTNVWAKIIMSIVLIFI